MMTYTVVDVHQARFVMNRAWLCSTELDQVELSIELLRASHRDLSHYVVMGVRPGDQYAQRICRADLWRAPDPVPSVRLHDPEGDAADEQAAREYSDFLNRDR